MLANGPGFSRRRFVAAAGISIGAGPGGWDAPEALAQAPPPALWGAEYWAKKGDVSLYMYRKRVGAPMAGETKRPVLFLVHGSSISARPSFDLEVPGRGEYSLMNVFARHGFDVWTMDHEGYGRSTRTAGNSDIASGVEDLKAGMEIVGRETAQAKIHLYGGSSGALRAAAFASARPEQIDRLILVAFTYTGEGSSTLADRAKQLEYYRTHNRRPRGRDMIRSIFTRDKPGTSDPLAAEALADAELQFGDTIPTGTYLDMTANLPVVDPLKVQAPVLMIRGEHDGIAAEDDLWNFYKRLPNGERQFAIVPSASHAAALGNNRAQLWHVMHSFLTMPPRADV
ncbi:MAG: alpha/beta fold hydrolase [Proteobacteria bacterium]|nr:alpha/beta fold hydrolase [Pseudomonadota bacterium]